MVNWKCKPPKSNEPTCIPVVNIVCPSCFSNQDADRTCLPTELIKNGSFEQAGMNEVFANWQTETDAINVFQFFDLAYEGNASAGFSSLPSAEPLTKTARLSQNVNVPPGCFLALSFADNFLQAGNGFESLEIMVRVYFGTNNIVDLINTQIKYVITPFNQAGQGFVFHQKVTDFPVPVNISNVTVEFIVSIRDTNPAETSWFLDSVSLRAV